jgi:hypothetical protein
MLLKDQMFEQPIINKTCFTNPFFGRTEEIQVERQFKKTAFLLSEYMFTG